MRRRITDPKKRRRSRVRRLLVFGLPIMVIAGTYVLTCTGPSDLSKYPPAANSPYRLPYEPGTSPLWVQGNRSTFSHRREFEYAFDFLMPTGTPVTAARSGEVVEVDVSRAGIGNFSGNRIVVEHKDGTRALYVHLEQGGSLVSEGQHVEQGDVIGRSGCTGRSLYPHLHFQVERHGQSVPISFSDVTRHAGIPRAGFSYEAGGNREDRNEAVTEVLGGS